MKARFERFDIYARPRRRVRAPFVALCLALGPLAFPLAAAESSAPTFHPLDLDRFLGTSFKEIDKDPDSSWKYAPHDRQVFEGVPFEMRGILEVSGLRAAREQRLHPTSVRDIPVSRKAARLHVIH
ncbi:MAG: hypothetical protein HYY24_10205, partial [Verrucomicrobia bacterium]|nr:hypothetical protein [Verrucomicrobiota bacterium]